MDIVFPSTIHSGQTPSINIEIELRLGLLGDFCHWKISQSLCDVGQASWEATTGSDIRHQRVIDKATTRRRSIKPSSHDNSEFWTSVGSDHRKGTSKKQRSGQFFSLSSTSAPRVVSGELHILHRRLIHDHSTPTQHQTSPNTPTLDTTTQNHP